MDVFNPFLIDFTVEIVETDVPVQDGNIDPITDFSTIPVVSTSGITQLPVSSCAEMF